VFFGLVGPDRGLRFLAFLTTAALGAWVFGRVGGVAADGARQVQGLVLATFVLVGGGWMFVDTTIAAPDTCVGDEPASTELTYDRVPWQTFSPERVEALRGHTLFLDFTADWCVSCKFNEKTVLETRAVRDAMAEHRVIALQADFTRQDPVLKGWLDQFHRAGVPMYVVVPPTGIEQAVLLPEVITPSLVVDALASAAGESVSRP
jgi:thiol:disulfide interchange protein DsbD